MRFVDDVPLIYNIQNVDKSKTIYAVEGPIDSLFLPNCIAVSGSDFKKISNLKINLGVTFRNIHNNDAKILINRIEPREKQKYSSSDKCNRN